MNSFCSLIVVRDLITDEKEINRIKDLGYELYDVDDQTIISNPILYCDEDDENDSLAFDDFMTFASKMVNELNVCLSEIEIYMEEGV
jgi:hypothetical protein